MQLTFVNCDNGDVFQEPWSDSEEDDYLRWYQKEFIWRSHYHVSPDGRYMLVFGCCWGGPYLFELYDISDLPNSIQLLSLPDLIESDKTLIQMIGCDEDDEFKYEYDLQNDYLYVYLRLKKDKNSEKKLYYRAKLP